VRRQQNTIVNGVDKMERSLKKKRKVRGKWVGTRFIIIPQLSRIICQGKNYK